MVTYAQAQERAEEWINGDVPAYQHREVRVREFELGFVVWAEDRAEGPRSDGGAQRLVLARDSGEVTLWPSLPVGEVIRRYEEEYGRPDAVPQDAPPPAPARMDLNQTSFLLTPPEWLQEAADRLGIPDQRRDRTSGGAAGVAAGAPETAGAGVPGAESARGDAGEPGGAGTVGAGADAGRAVASGASAGADAPGAPEGGARWPAPTAGEARDAGAGPQDRLPGAPPGATPWTGTDITVDADDEDRSVALPATVFAPPLSAPDEESAPAAGTEAKTALMSGGSALPPTTVAPAVDTPGGPAAPSSYGYPAPGAPPAGNAPGGPGAPQYGYPPQGGQPAAGGAAGLAGAETRKAPPPGGTGSGSVPPPPGAPGAPGAPYAAPAAPPSPSAPGAPGAPAGGALQAPGTPPGGVHHAATMLAGPSVGGPGVPPPPGAPGAPGGAQVPPPGAPGAPAGPGAPQAPGAPGAPAGGAPQAPGTPPGGVHHAATMLAGPSVGGPGAPPPPPPPGAPGAPGGVQVPPPGAPGVPGANPPQAPGGTPPGGVHHAATMLAGPAVGGPGAPQAPGAPGAPGAPAGSGGVHHAETVLAGPAMGGPGVPPPPGAPGMPPGAVPPPPPPPPVPGMPGGPGAPGGAYGYPPAGQPTVGPGYQAVLRYRAQDGSEQQLIRRSAPGTPHPEWQIFHELRGLNVPSDQVLELHTELESCHLPGAYCARMIGEQWPNARITSIAPYGTDHASRQQGMQQLLAHQGELHQVADGPARPAPVRTPIPPVPPAPPVPPEGIAHELAAAFGPGVFRFDQAAVSRQGVPPVVAHTLVVAGLPVDMGPFFWAQAQPGRPVPTLAELAQERGVRPAADAGSYLVMGSDFGKALCVQYGTANIVAVPVEAGPDGASAPPQFVNTGLPEFARCLALLGRMWRLRYGLNQEQAGRWTVDFQAQLAALDPAALNSPESWWSVLLEQMWDGLL
ncbi:SUKH-4 family immunity protein [Streptomyces griseoaurantiacus]|uniref:SUKH-4 family immunity protein n=1 Tax=Streptomyces griseoaurantiacus TaxID=68213 RepID=UPI00325607E9